jgi:hypothetical protein
MYKIITTNHLCFIGKISDLLEVLEDLSKKYTTLHALIQDHLKP